MSKSWKDKGWNNMESILDEAMPVQRRPLLLPFPVQLRIATVALLILGTAFWGLHLVNSGNNLNSLSAFDFTTSQEISTSEVKPTQLKSSNQSTIVASATISPESNLENIPSIPAKSSGRVESKIQPPGQSEIIEDLVYSNIEEMLVESTTPRNFAVKAAASNISNADDSKAAKSSVFNTSDKVIEPNEVPSVEKELASFELKSDQTEIVPMEASPIVNPKLNTSFSMDVSAGNYSFSSPNLYGQIQLNMHIPISTSFNMNVLAGAGKGLIYQNSEVFLAEYSNKPKDGTVLGSEAPGDDLSAYIDVKSVSNALIGSQIQWQFSNKWSFAVGASASYLFKIQHQANQSTSLVPPGQSPQQIFTAAEISEQFAHWNHWDLRLNASLQFHMTRNWSLAMSYNRGLTNLLKHPISSEHNIQMNSLSLGFNYKF